MLPDHPLPVTQTNHGAVISLSAGVLALMAVCIAVIPVPFTGYICFPAGAILTVISIWHGIRALRRHGAISGGEKAMSMAGITASALAVLLGLCSLAVVAILGLRLVEAIGQLFR